MGEFFFPKLISKLVEATSCEFGHCWCARIITTFYRQLVSPIWGLSSKIRCAPKWVDIRCSFWKGKANKTREFFMLPYKTSNTWPIKQVNSIQNAKMYLLPFCWGNLCSILWFIVISTHLLAFHEKWILVKGLPIILFTQNFLECRSS